MNREHERSVSAGWPRRRGGETDNEVGAKAPNIADSMVPSVARLASSPATTDGACRPGNTRGKAPQDADPG